MTEHVLTRRAPKGAATSWSDSDRTFRATIAAGAAVRRYDRDGEFTEILDHAGVELPRQIPLLNTHRSGDVRDVIGTVEKVERIGERLEAVLRLSARPELAGIAADVRDGVLTATSIGYAVAEWIESEDADGRRTKTAARWRLMEVSLVPIPADDQARIRSFRMDENELEEGEAPTMTRSADHLARGEQRRVARITEAGDRLGERAFAELHIEEGTSVEDFHRLLVDHIAKEHARQRGPEGMTSLGDAFGGGGFDNPRVRAAAMAEAVACRIDGTEPSAQARHFAGLSLPELAREHLRALNIDVRGQGRSWLVNEALNARGLGGLHSTSDFANVLSDAVGRVLRRAYDAAPSGLKPVARRVELDDFRARTFVGMSGFSALEKVNEHGEFKRGTLKDTGESVRLQTFGRVFGITRQAVINDDLSAFAEMPRRLGVAASQFEADQLASLLVANPLMSDGKAVFHADHANLASSAAALSKDALSAARKAMRAQKDDAGQLIGVAPAWLVVGPELETLAEELMTAITPNDTDAVQPIRLKIAVEPRLTGFQWYVAADPATIDGLVYAHLASEPGPQVAHRAGFDVDGVEMRVRLDFGCSFIEHRGWYKNAGADPGGE